MAELPKVLYDDHHRLERMFARWSQKPRADLITGIVDEIDICLTTADELALPVVNRLNPNLAQAMDTEHQRIRELSAEVAEYDAADPEVGKAMKRLERAVLVHINHMEKAVLPLLRTQVHRGELYELGRNAFALRQEMLGQLDFRPKMVPLGLPLSGWGSGRPSLDAGW